MKGRMKRAVSGFLTAVTLISTVFQPVNIYAAERDAAKEKPPLYEEVKDQLDEDEVVTAHDLEIGVGYSLDVKADFSGIKIADRKKVKVTFEEAFNEQGETFTTDHEDTYTAVYYVEPQKTDHPKYQISRKLIVKEGAAVVQTKESAEAASGENSGDAEEESEDADPDHAEMTENIQMETGLPEENSTEPETEIHSEEELDQELEEAETQETVDSETGLSLGSVMLQAVEQGVNLLELEEGESLQFTARSVNLFSAKASQQVTVTAGEWYHYADYGLGSYLTCHYTVSFGNVKATAYCVQHPNRDQEMELIPLQGCKMEKRLQKYVITERKQVEMKVSLQRNIRSFQQEKDLSLPILQRLMQMGAVMLFPVPMQQERHWLWNFMITVSSNRIFQM